MSGNLLYRKHGQTCIAINCDDDESIDILRELGELGIELEAVNESPEYMAGLMDGEGTITLSNKGEALSPRVSFPQSNLSQVCLFREMAGFGGVYFQKGSNSWYWASSKKEDVFGFLSRIRSALIFKKQQANLVMEFIELRRTAKYGDGYAGRQDEILKEIRRLNTRPSRSRNFK